MTLIPYPNQKINIVVMKIIFALGIVSHKCSTLIQKYGLISLVTNLLNVTFKENDNVIGHLHLSIRKKIKFILVVNKML